MVLCVGVLHNVAIQTSMAVDINSCPGPSPRMSLRVMAAMVRTPSLLSDLRTRTSAAGPDWMLVILMPGPLALRTASSVTCIAARYHRHPPAGSVLCQDMSIEAYSTRIR